MAQTEADICNQALIQVGQTKFIASLNDPTEAARICKVVYPNRRDEVLRAYAWQFATKHVTLAQLANVTRTGWSLVYRVPIDCIAARYISNGLRLGAPVAPMSSLTNSALVAQGPYPASVLAARVPFVIEASDDGNYQVLLTDQTGAELVYTMRVTNPVVFSSDFTRALVLYIAGDLACGLLKKPALGDALEKKAMVKLASAAAAGMREQREDPEGDSATITVRG